MDPTRLHAFMTQPNSVATASALKPTNSRQAKRLLVTNVPQGTDEETLLQFFNRLLSPLNVITGGPDPVTLVQLNADKSLGMVEFKNTSDTTVGLAFSGIEFGGAQLEIRRPKDYIVPLVVEDATETEPGQISSTVPDTPNKILVSRIPNYLQDDQVIELLKSFGELKAFVLVKDTTDEVSKVSYTPHTNR
jgi:splicing factor U2AF subunit